MGSRSKPKNQLRIPEPEAVLVDKRTVIGRKQYQLAVNLLGDTQRYLMLICAAVRMHREQQWNGASVDDEMDSRLYAVLDHVVEENNASRGQKKRKRVVS